MTMLIQVGQLEAVFDPQSDSAGRFIQHPGFAQCVADILNVFRVVRTMITQLFQKPERMIDLTIILAHGARSFWLV